MVVTLDPCTERSSSKSIQPVTMNDAQQIGAAAVDFDHILQQCEDPAFFGQFD